MNEILLRPHHALCIRFFEGKGYSGEFTKHMAKIIKKLQEPGQLIVLADEEDEICGKCPNYLENGCRQKEKVKGYDERVLEMTGMSCGEKIDFRILWELVEKKIMEAGKFHEICGGCSWAAICHRGTF